MLLPLLFSGYASGFNDFYMNATPQPTAVHCARGVDPDFRNFGYTLGPLNRHTQRIHLHDGRYDEVDMGQVDWRTTIQPVLPMDYGKTRVWFVVLERDHWLGTGFFRHVFVFQCRDRSLVRLFRAGGEGLYDAYLFESGFSLERGIWLRYDAHASPSLQQTYTYQWDARAGRFELIEKSKPRAIDPLKP